MAEGTAEQDQTADTQGFAGICASLISYLAWATLMAFAYHVKEQGTTGSGYSMQQTAVSLSTEHWALWASLPWFVLGSFFLWAARKRLSDALVLLQTLVFFTIVGGIFAGAAIVLTSQPAHR